MMISDHFVAFSSHHLQSAPPNISWCIKFKSWVLRQKIPCCSNALGNNDNLIPNISESVPKVPSYWNSEFSSPDFVYDWKGFGQCIFPKASASVGWKDVSHETEELLVCMKISLGWRENEETETAIVCQWMECTQLQFLQKSSKLQTLTFNTGKDIGYIALPRLHFCSVETGNPWDSTNANPSSSKGTDCFTESHSTTRCRPPRERSRTRRVPDNTIVIKFWWVIEKKQICFVTWWFQTLPSAVL